MTDPLKPGWKSSEFWITVLTAALAFVSALSTAMGWAFNGAHLAPLIPVAATVLAGLIATVYNHGRAQVKVAAIAAAAMATDPPTLTVTPPLTLGSSNTGGHVVAAGNSGPGDVVDPAPVPVADPPADPAVADAVPEPTPATPDTPPVPPSEVAPAPVAVDDVPPLIGT